MSVCYLKIIAIVVVIVVIVVVVVVATFYCLPYALYLYMVLFVILVMSFEVTIVVIVIVYYLLLSLFLTLRSNVCWWPWLFQVYDYRRSNDRVDLPKRTSHRHQTDTHAHIASAVIVWLIYSVMHSTMHCILFYCIVLYCTVLSRILNVT